MTEAEEEDSDDDAETQMNEELNRSEEYSEESDVDELGEDEAKVEEPSPAGKKRKTQMPGLVQTQEVPPSPPVSPLKRRRDVFEVVRPCKLCVNSSRI